MTERTNSLYADIDLAQIKEAQTFFEMAQIAIGVLEKMTGAVAQVCGPISTGGLGSVEANLQKFDETIVKLKNKGVNIFDQMPFEWPMQKLKEKPDFKPDDLLLEFYLPIFESGYIKMMYFMNDWQSSYGARWERAQAKRLGIEIIDLE